MKEHEPKHMHEADPMRESEKEYGMNLLTHREAVIEAIAKIEGEYWVETEKENGRYSVDGALAEAQREPYGEGCIYGYGGTHRYFVRNDGSVYYSEGHGRTSLEQARKLGFLTLADAPPRWPE